MLKKKTIKPQRLMLITVLLLMGMLIVACDSAEDTPPTEIRIVSPQPTDVVTGGDNQDGDFQATLDAISESQANLQATIDAQATQLAESNASTSDAPSVDEGTLVANALTDTAEAATDTPVPTSEPRPTQEPTATDLPSLFPTQRVEQTILVEQVFENGHMFWFRDRRTIWVAVGEEGEVDPESGTWLCFVDEFSEGDVERVDEFAPPEDVTTESELENADPQQPIRGFGLLWRENEDLREQLGWALAPEIESISNRTYTAGGFVNDEDEYVPAAGEYRVFSFYNKTFIFLEDELGQGGCPEGTWRSRPVN